VELLGGVVNDELVKLPGGVVSGELQGGVVNDELLQLQSSVVRDESRD
jgi:hypothetical protein